jgi:hypothetical protein
MLSTVITVTMANIAFVSKSNNIIFTLKSIKLLTYENYLDVFSRIRCKIKPFQGMALPRKGCFFVLCPLI